MPRSLKYLLIFISGLIFLNFAVSRNFAPPIVKHIFFILLANFVMIEEFKYTPPNERIRLILYFLLLLLFGFFTCC
jgi:hypothetical protein